MLRLIFLLLLGSVAMTWADDWGALATISNTMGINGGRLCSGEATRGDIGCPNYAPSLSTAGHVSITGNISAAKVIGDGSGLTNISGGDRITSGTSSVTVQSGGVVSITTNGTTTNYFNASGLLVTPGISTTTLNGISSTNGYFSGNVGVGTSDPSYNLDVSGSLRIKGVGTSSINELILEEPNAGSAAQIIFINPSSTWSLGADANPHGFYIGPMAGGTSAAQETFFINPSGYVGIGTTNPTTNLDIVGNINSSLSITAGSNLHVEGNTDDVGAPGTNFYDGMLQIVEVNATSGKKNAMIFDGNEIQSVSQTTASASVADTLRLNAYGGTVAIGHSSYGSNLVVYGTVASCTLGSGTGNTSCSSDRRLKQDIQPLHSSLEKITALQGVHFKWKKDPSETRIGLIAQDVEKQFPEVVETNPETGMKAVAYASLVAPLIEAMKEQQAEIRKLRADVEALKAKSQRKSRK